MAESIKVLRSTEEIADFLKCSPKTVNKYIEMGMPVVKILNSIHAHADNIEEWFRRITLKTYQE